MKVKLFLAVSLLLVNLSVIAQIDLNHDYTKVLDLSDDNNHVTPNMALTDNNSFVWIGTEMGMYRYDGENVVKIVPKDFPEIANQRISRMFKNQKEDKIYFYCFPLNNWYVIHNSIIKKLKLNHVQNQCIYALNCSYYECKNSKLKQTFHLLGLPNNKLNDIRINTYFRVQHFYETSNFYYIHKFDSLITINKSSYKLGLKIPLPEINQVLKFGDDIFFLNDKNNENYKIYIIKKGKIVLPYTGKMDAIVSDFLKHFNYHSAGYKFFIEYGNRYYLQIEKKIYSLEYVNGCLSARFLFSIPFKTIIQITYDNVTQQYYVMSYSGEISIHKLTPFNHIHFNNGNLDVNYEVGSISNHEIYSSSGWKYDIDNQKILIDKNIKQRNRSCILNYKGKWYVQNQHFLVNIQNSNDKLFKNHIYKSEDSLLSYCYHQNILWVTNSNAKNALIYFKNQVPHTDHFIVDYFKGTSVLGVYNYNQYLLLATTKGLYRYIPFTQKIYPIKGFENKYCRKVIPTEKNNYWVCTYGSGLFYGERFKIYKIICSGNNGFKSAHTVEEDYLGRIWISSNEGLFVAQKKKVIDNALNGKATEFYKYTVQDGLLSNEFNGGSSRESVNFDKKIIGFSGMNGFTWFDSQKLHSDIFEKIIIIDNVATEKGKVKEHNNIFNFQKESEFVTIDFSYAYHYNRKNLIVSVYSPDDKEWVTVNKTTIHIDRPGSGKCVVLIRIHTLGTSKDKDVIKKVFLNFEARYYETFWFWANIAGVFLLMLFSAYHIGLLINKKRALYFEQKVEEKTKELVIINEELTVSKEKITKSLREKELLLKEIHHRVKNNLQLVISLLNIQGRTNNYLTIEEFLEKGQTRIIAMVLIHQNLYQSDTLEKLNIKDYLDNLNNAIIKSYGSSNDSIKIIVETNNIFLNLQTSIPFGLIINELVTNSLKYAFPNNDNGEIKIKLNQLKNDEFKLVFEDNGLGFEKSKLKTNTFGLELIELLVSQLGGTLHLESDGKTRYTITFIQSEI